MSRMRSGSTTDLISPNEAHSLRNSTDAVECFAGRPRAELDRARRRITDGLDLHQRVRLDCIRERAPGIGDRAAIHSKRSRSTSYVSPHHVWFGETLRRRVQASPDADRGSEGPAIRVTSR